MTFIDVFSNPLLSKALIIFIVGLVEQFIYSWHLLLLTRKKAISSSLVLFFNIIIYLLIIANIINDINQIFWFIPIYALGCGLGNYLRIKGRLYRDRIERRALRKVSRLRKLRKERKKRRGKKEIHKKKLHKSSK